MSRSSYAFDTCAMIRQRNGEANVGIAAISTRQRLPSGADDDGCDRGHASIGRRSADVAGSHSGGSVGPNSRGTIASACECSTARTP